MKKVTAIFVAMIFFVFLSSEIISQTVELSGSQTRGTAGKNASLSCVPVTINKTMKISEVSGDNAGFWIIKGSVAIAYYYKPNDPAAVGLELKPGTYYVYPNLKQNQNTAKVKLTLK